MWAILSIIGDFLGKISWQVWVALVILVTIGGMGWMIHHKDITIQKQEQQITALNSAITQEKTEIVNYQKAINLQNAQITEFADNTKKDEATIDGLTGTLAALQTTQGTKITDIKKEPVAKNCSDAMGYLRNNLKELTW